VVALNVVNQKGWGTIHPIKGGRQIVHRRISSLELKKSQDLLHMNTGIC